MTSTICTNGGHNFDILCLQLPINIHLIIAHCRLSLRTFIYHVICVSVSSALSLHYPQDPVISERPPYS